MTIGVEISTIDNCPHEVQSISCIKVFNDNDPCGRSFPLNDTTCPKRGKEVVVTQDCLVTVPIGESDDVYSAPDNAEARLYHPECWKKE